jgi:RHS repeat-associated protein
VQLEEPDGQVWKAEWLHGKIWKSVQPNGCTLLYLVNREGTLIEQQNEKGEVRTLTPNVDGIYTRIESFDGRVQRFKYDAMNRLVEYENGRAEKRKYERNAAGQVMEVTFADDTSSTFEYDLRGHLVRATNPSGSYVYDRDAAGALIKETHIAPDGAIHVETTFDAIRDKVRIATSLGHEHAVERGPQGTAIRSTLDGVESLSFLYDPVGREVARAFSRGALQETEYGLEGPYTRRRVLSPLATFAPQHGPAEPEWVGAQPGNAVVAKAFRFSRNAQQPVSRWDSSFGGLQYEYDQREQLVATVDVNGAAERFRYDEARNISHDGTHPRRYRKGNVLEEKGSVRYLWDADGCLVEKRELAADGTERTWRYEWSGAGDLARVVTPEGTEVEFAYDPFSRRVRKEVFERSGGERALRSSTRYVWSDTKILHEIRRTAHANGDPVVHERTYAYDPNDLFPLGHREDVSSPAGRKAGAWTYYVSDPLGTPEHLVTGDGKVVGEMSRSAWGVATATGETTPHRFQGQWADPETGLHYNRYRYYDPDTGRYVSQDPAGNLPDPNLYLYCWNPIGWVDPDGLAHTATGTFTPAGGGPPINLGTTSSYNSEPDNYSRNYNAANGINPFQNLTARGPNGELLHRTSDTEQQMIRDLEARQAAGQVNLQGGHLEINGTLPPCPACHREMQAFAARNNCTVTYNHTGDPNSRIAANRTPGTTHYP